VSGVAPIPPPATPASAADRRSWTVKLREAGVGTLPPEKLLPDGQPTYVASWIYVFGVASIASLVVIVGSGSILALKGPAWWHETNVGHFFNSIHLWAVELFFFVMVVHLWGKYWMAAWRGGRARVWITGAIVFLIAIPTALTGYVSQQNFDAQWISTQAKDAMNSVGVGSFFNLLDFGQMYSWHILLLPVAVVALVTAHVLLVRTHGVVPPFELEKRLELATAAAGGDRAAAGDGATAGDGAAAGERSAAGGGDDATGSEASS
jgi:ubiquinol-cytochrome c reductase cytochrome b subunit